MKDVKSQKVWVGRDGGAITERRFTVCKHAYALAETLRYTKNNKPTRISTLLSIAKTQRHHRINTKAQVLATHIINPHAPHLRITHIVAKQYPRLHLPTNPPTNITNTIQKVTELPAIDLPTTDLSFLSLPTVPASTTRKSVVHYLSLYDSKQPTQEPLNKNLSTMEQRTLIKKI
jgi:hypothetical protein